MIGVSGGADSLCLLDVMCRLGYSVVAAHLDHGLRPSSGEEAGQVEALAQRLGAPCVVEQADVTGYARQNSLGIESAARQLRYRFLFKQAHLHGAQAVAVGHHADDQVETVLMHLLRGAGLEGLGGMDYRLLPNPWSAEIPLVRPLLGVWRHEIETYVAERGYQPNVDESNADQVFLRNRIRHTLIPELESYNPRARQAVWRMAEVLRGERQAVQALLEPLFRRCLLESGSGYAALEAVRLAGEPAGIQRRLLRMALEQVQPGLDEIDLELVERARHALASPLHSQELDLGNGLRMVLEGGRLWLAAWQVELPAGDFPQLAGAESLRLEAPGKVLLANGWELTGELIQASPELVRQSTTNANPYQAWLDAASLSLPLDVRRRQPGDRMAPLGMGGHSLKLSDLMINLKVPRRARSGWPVVLSAGEVVWAPGMRQAHAHRVSEDCLQILCIRLQKSSTPGA